MIFSTVYGININWNLIANKKLPIRVDNTFLTTHSEQDKNIFYKIQNKYPRFFRDLHYLHTIRLQKYIYFYILHII